MTNADIEALDQSRRVGWAKAYQATERLDDALKDCNIAWGDRDAYRNGLSFVVGMLMQRAKNEPSTMNRMMLNEGVLMATRGLMIGSTPMTDADVDETVERCGRAFARFASDAAASAT